MNIEVGDLVIRVIRDGESKILQVKSIDGDKALCVSHVNEEQACICSISELTKANDPTDT